MNIEAIQDSIVTQLAAAFAASSLPFSAVKLPEAVADYKRAVSTPIAYVIYTGSTSPGVKSTNPVMQDRKIQFSVEVFSRNLYGSQGLFVVRDYVEKALIGFRPLGCDRLYLVKDDISKDDDSFWGHIFQLECLTMLVQESLTEPVVVENFVKQTALFENAGNPSDAANGDETLVIPQS